MIILFTLAIGTSLIAIGLMFYWLFRQEFEHQAWERVSDGTRVTQTLINAEKDRLNSLANHTTQRPTLLRLVQENNQPLLLNYLQAFKSGVDLDFIFISDGFGNPVVGTDPINLPFDITKSTNAGFYTLEEAPDQLIVAATQSLPNELNQDAYFVTLGIYLDDEFIQKISLESGFEQSLLIDGQPLATSLTSMPADRIDAEEILFKQDNLKKIRYGGTQYYTTEIPLNDHQNNRVASMEVALSVDSLKTVRSHFLFVLGIGTLLIAGIGSFFVSVFARHLIAPLQNLTESAIKISQEELDTPILVPESPVEISSLARALDESRRKTQQRLEIISQTNIFWETLIQSIPEGIITLDNLGGITSFNQGAENITGWKTYEVLGSPINRIIKVPDREGGFTGNIRLGGGAHQICILNKKEQEVLLSVTGVSTKLADIHGFKTAYVLRDITEKEAAHRLRSHFLANISREFRTPISVLNLSIERLMEGINGFSQAETIGILESIHFSVIGLQNLIDNLLESALIDIDPIRIRQRLADFNDIVSEAARITQPLLRRRNQTLCLNIAPDLPLVNVDQNRLAQVLRILLSNASKNSPLNEKISLIVTVLDEQTLYFAVQDRGPGFSQPDLSNLFKRFTEISDQEEYQIDLGLSVVKSIVDEHGGELGVEVSDGGGSSFWIKIPLNGLY